MQENEATKNSETELDLKSMLSAVGRKWWVLAICALLLGALAFGYTRFFVTPKYQSSAMFYVNNGSLSMDSMDITLSSGALTASKDLVNSYIVLLTARSTLLDVIDYAGEDITYGQLRGMISASSVNETEIFRVVVTSPDPYQAERLANAIAHVLPKRISSIIEGTSAKVVDTAIVATAPSSPSYSRNVTLGLLLGALFSAVVIALKEFFDVSIRSDEDIANCGNLPILTAVPDMSAKNNKAGYGYGNTKSAYNTTPAGKQSSFIGGDINFAATEAYKLLRTKLQFAFADDKPSHVIGVSSSLAGEGKSLSAINLAYSLSQLDKKVLLIDCDMRRPSLSAKLPITKRPGLSGCLTGQSNLAEVVQHCVLKSGDPSAFDVIASGQTPPNPVELLSSTKMSSLLETLKQTYQYIILDLPPVAEVTDALAVAKETDGMLLVVRQRYCTRLALRDTVQQFDYVDSRILGVVYNCVDDPGVAYSNTYKRYYRRYSRRYAGSYVRNIADPRFSIRKDDASKK